jgi:DNA-binding response OmpR family regulator
MTNKILIVDDDEGIRDLLRGFLDLKGYQTCAASNGVEGLRQLYEQQPDLVVTDCFMPEMDGREFCQLVHQAADVPVLMISGMGQAEVSDAKVLPLSTGVSAYMTKPFQMDKFLDTVRTLLSRMSPSENPSADEDARSSISVLVVDDQPAIRDLLTECLHMLGYKAHTASSGAEGLHKLYKQRPDLVVTDYLMPGMDGYEFSRLVRYACNVPIMMLTCLSDKEGSADEPGLVDTCIGKPISIYEFGAQVEELLHRHTKAA